MTDKATISKFIDLAKEHTDAQFRNQPIKRSRAGSGLYRIWQTAKHDSEFGHGLVDALICNGDPNVRIWICSIAFDIGYRTYDAEQNLEQVINMPDIGLLGDNARVILEGWRKNVKPEGTDLI